jgi:hypothetical protein
MRAIWIALLLAACGDGGTTGGGDLAGPKTVDLSIGGGTGPCDTYPTTMSASQERSRCGLGTDAAALIRATPYKKLVIEVAATAGSAPSAAALSHLQAIVQDVCDKPGGVTVQMGDMNIPPLGHAMTIDDVRAMEDAHRHQFALGDTAVFFYLVVSDPSADDMNGFKVLGIAHRASSMVVYQGSIKSVSGGLGQPSADTVETAVVAHEYGHVLGLVNIATPMVTPHQDTAHGAHDSNDKCLMYYLNNSSAGLAGNLLSGGTVPDFDAQCRADLLAIKNAQ